MKKKPLERCAKTALFLLSFVLISPQMSIADDAVRYFDKGTNFLREGKLHEAIAALTKAVALRSGYAIAYNNRGLAYYKQSKYVKAAGDFRKAIQFNPNNELAYNNIAVVFCKQGDYDKALLYLDKTIALIKEIKPSHADVFNNRGFIYMKKGMHKESADAYNYARHIIQSKTTYYSDNYDQITLDQRIEGHPVTVKFYGE
ncbi:MAG: tetratricopeptide repeat protein [Deltaproteobacteria bacterium]|nr:tetratricopeptide repeat protein [Deltaproteobacteria bacterium]